MTRIISLQMRKCRIFSIKAHQLPYGDVLVEFLKLFVRTFSSHVHPYPGLPPCQTTDYLETTSYDLDKILSESVRIN